MEPNFVPNSSRSIHRPSRRINRGEKGRSGLFCQLRGPCSTKSLKRQQTAYRSSARIDRIYRVKIQFDSNQDYQLDAIKAVVDVFDGQPLAQGEYEIRFDAVGGDLLSDLGVGNNLVLDESRVVQNIQAVQEQNEIQPRVEDLSQG